MKFDPDLAWGGGVVGLILGIVSVIQMGTVAGHSDWLTVVAFGVLGFVLGGFIYRPLAWFRIGLLRWASRRRRR